MLIQSERDMATIYEVYILTWMNIRVNDNESLASRLTQEQEYMSHNFITSSTRVIWYDHQNRSNYIVLWTNLKVSQTNTNKSLSSFIHSILNH